MSQASVVLALSTRRIGRGPLRHASIFFWTIVVQAAVLASAYPVTAKRPSMLAHTPYVVPPAKHSSSRPERSAVEDLLFLHARPKTQT